MNKTSILALALTIVLATSVLALITPENAKISVKIKNGNADIKAKNDSQKFRFNDLSDKADALSKIALVLNTEVCTNPATLPIAQDEKIKIGVKIKKGNADLKSNIYGEGDLDDDNKPIKFKTSDKGALLSKIASVLGLETIPCLPPPPPG